MLRVRQIPFIMGTKTTLPPNSPLLKISSIMTLMESWLRQVAVTDFTGQDKMTKIKSVAQKKAPWILRPLTQHLRVAGSKSGLSMGHSCLGKKKDLQIQDSLTLPTIPPVPSPFSLFPTWK